MALNFFGKPILTLREKRREALEVGERCAYVGLDLVIGDDALGLLRFPPNDDQKRAFSVLHGAGNSLRAHFRERSLVTRIDLDYAARALLGLAEAARDPYPFSERTRRLTLHVLFVALGATHHLSAGEIAAAREEMKQWHDGNRDMTTSSSAADKA